MRILWVQEMAAPHGGCERYIADTVALLRERGVHNILLYNPNQSTETAFLQGFDEAWPMVDPATQVASLAPDVIYVHRLEGRERLEKLVASGVPVARFFHDHRLFCPRTHKYTAFGQETCTSRVGAGCFACAGCLVKTEAGLGFVPPWAVERELEANRGLSAFVVGSRYMEDHLRLHDFEASRVHTIPLYTALPHSAGPAPQRERDLVLFVGTLTTGKGVDTLLKARALTRSPIRVAIVGAGKFEASYRALVKRLGLESCVTFAGRVDPPHLGEWYQRAHAVVMPSRTPETFGLVGAEALAHGTPVVAALVGGVREWLRDGYTGLGVPPNDPATLAQAMDRLYDDPVLARRLGEAGHDFVRDHLSPRRHVDHLLGLFSSLSRKELTNAA